MFDDLKTSHHYCADVQITAYCTDRILSKKTDKQSDRLIFYNEPTPETVGPLLEYLGDTPVQKMLVCSCCVVRE